MRRSLTKHFKKLSLSSKSTLELSSPPVSGSVSTISPDHNVSSDSSTSSLPPLPRLPSRPLAPGDEYILPAGHIVTASDLRALNELILQRYTLDAWIWRLKKCKPRDKDIVIEKGRQADAALARIMAMVRAWDNPDVWAEEEEWAKLREIRARLERDGKRVWEGNPPWKDKD
ncbi:hypothetical protein BGZ60DRAFT_395168 [Tricladium varicosporioides]|nr:hypothetical protein BGZ60DRAFT_395168 [Hymenoscyphus varicosporioides]